MVNWKSKYLEMKLKYINSKNKLTGGYEWYVTSWFLPNVLRHGRRCRDWLE